MLTATDSRRRRSCEGKAAGGRMEAETCTGRRTWRARWNTVIHGGGRKDRTGSEQERKNKEEQCHMRQKAE